MSAKETTDDIAEERSTAPQSPFTQREVAAGAAILLVGLVLVFVIPAMLTL